jgi:hypothetical protein
VARVVKDQASDDIWHLSIEDLLAPPGEPARAAGPGPFVINLRTSSATIGSPPKGLLPIGRGHVYQLERTHDGRPQFQLRLGIIESELEADALLSLVREHYPAAIRETAQDDDKTAIARAARTAEPVKPASGVADAKAPVAPKRRKPTPPAARHAAQPAARQAARAVERQAARPAARQAAAESAEHFRWDIDELLPGLAAAWPPTSAPEPTLPLFAAPKGERKPSKLSASRGSARLQMPTASAAAPSTKVSARSGVTPPSERARPSQTSQHVTNTPPAERRERPSVAPTQVPGEPRERVNPAPPPAKTARLSGEVSHSVSLSAGAPTSAVVEEIESDPNAVTDQVEVLTLRSERQTGAATAAPPPPATTGSTEYWIEQKLLDVPKPAPARPELDLQSLDAPAPTEPRPVTGADFPTFDSVRPEPHAVIAAPAPAADTPEKPPVASAEDADSEALHSPVAKIGALMDSAETHQDSANAPESDANASVAAAPPAGSLQLTAPEPLSPSAPQGTPQPASAPAGAPVMDSTQTVRALTPFELAQGEASCWFAIQLMLREEPIDAEQVPNLPIFAEYRLYSVTGLEQDRVMHALRVGFFSTELAAEAVAGYLGSYFDSPVIKRVSIAERERFADAVVAARKDVGTAALHTVIELASPAPPAERRLAAPSDRRAAASDRRKSAANQAASLWSRLIAPRDR